MYPFLKAKTFFIYGSEQLFEEIKGITICASRNFQSKKGNFMTSNSEISNNYHQQWQIIQLSAYKNKEIMIHEIPKIIITIESKNKEYK